MLYEVEVEGKPDHSPVYWSNSTGPDPQVATVCLALSSPRPQSQNSGCLFGRTSSKAACPHRALPQQLCRS